MIYPHLQESREKSRKIKKTFRGQKAGNSQCLGSVQHWLCSVLGCGGKCGAVLPGSAPTHFQEDGVKIGKNKENRQKGTGRLAGGRKRSKAGAGVVRSI